MPGRTSNSPSYRYGFNGKEKDESGEWGDLTHYDYGFRIYNPGIARFLSVDPLAPDYPWYTPYQFAGNTPIRAIDLDGAEPFVIPAGLLGSSPILAASNAGTIATVGSSASGAGIAAGASAAASSGSSGLNFLFRPVGPIIMDPGTGVNKPGSIPGEKAPDEIYYEPFEIPFSPDVQIDSPQGSSDSNPWQSPWPVPEEFEHTGEYKDEGPKKERLKKRNEERRNEPHEVYEIFGYNTKTKGKVTLKYGINSIVSNPFRAMKQIANERSKFSLVYSDLKNPLNKLRHLGITLEGIDFNVLHVTTNKALAEELEQLQVDLYYYQHGDSPVEQGIPIPTPLKGGGL